MSNHREFTTANLNAASGGAITSTGQSASVHVGGYSEAIAMLNVTAASGTTPTLDVKLQTSYNGTDWYDIATAFTQATAVSKQAGLKATNLGQFLRAVWTIGGTTPSFTFDLNLSLKS